jgi:archaetidylinositol phosphate synthase
MLTRLKQEVQAILTAEANAADRIGLAPNMVTIIGVVLALLASIAYAEWRTQPVYLLAATALLLLSGLSDALDGAMARLHHKATTFGGFLDSLLDRYADAFVYIGIIIGALCEVTWGLIALTGTLLVSYSRARAEAAGVKMETIGLAERPERIIIIAVATVTAYFWQAETVMNATVILLAVLTNLTVLQRGIYVHNKLKETRK